MPKRMPKRDRFSIGLILLGLAGGIAGVIVFPRLIALRIKPLITVGKPTITTKV